MKYQSLIKLFILIMTGLSGCSDDYWSEQFDSNKNCKQEELMVKLQKEKTPSRCASKQKGSNTVQWEECKKELSTKLVQSCNLQNIEKTGDLLYCKDRGRTSCCFHNEVCAASYEMVEDIMMNQAIQFLTNTSAFLTDMVDNLNYDTCRPIKEYDASKCARDCKKLEKAEFAKNCTQNDGLFKCCIRRDAAYCHECRFCCTLSICTTPQGSYYRDSQTNDLSSSKDKDQKVNAKFGFETDLKMWKHYDYRCLKAKKSLHPENWPHFEMHGYRAAKTKSELKHVQEIKFDKYFFNFEDPKIFEEMMNGENRDNIWKRTYGFDFVSFNDKKNSRLPWTECYKNCFEAEFQSFARKCKEKGGLFKCCLSTLGTYKYELMRDKLQGKGLLDWNSVSEYVLCLDHGNSYEYGWDMCTICATTHICAVKNPLTGGVEETFRTPYTNMQHKVGGRGTGHGLKYWACHVQDTCRKQINSGDNFEPHQDFQTASTPEEFCDLTQIRQKGVSKRNETFQGLYYKECLKQESPSVFICPENEVLKSENKNALYVTKVLRKLRKNVVKKEKERIKGVLHKKGKKETKRRKEKKGKKAQNKRKERKKKKKKEKRKRRKFRGMGGKRRKRMKKKRNITKASKSRRKSKGNRKKSKRRNRKVRKHKKKKKIKG